MPERGQTSGDAPGLAPGALTQLVTAIARAPEQATRWDGVLRAGVTFGRFELVRELGRGGFGCVWEARDLELGRPVAFKALTSAFERSAGERGLREAEAAARLSHPNLVTLYDAGRCEHGAYLVMELLRGTTLGRRLALGPMPPREAVEVAAQIAKALAHAHAQGIAHRDLKPENVFLCDDGQVKVLDFGLAHVFGRRRIPGGTPGYMAPEQRTRAPEDERSDVFALGVMLFEALRGRLPRVGERALRRAAPPVELPEAPALAGLVSAMLAREPERRPRDAAEVLAALEQVQRDLDRAPILSTSVAANAHPARPRRIAVLPFLNLSGDPAQEYFCDGITEEITAKLARLGGLGVSARTSTARYRRSTKGARRIGAELDVSHLLEGSIRRDGDRIRVAATLVDATDGFHVWSEELDARVDDVFSVQERVAARIVEALGLRLTRAQARVLTDWGTRNAAAYDELLKGYALVGHPHGGERYAAARAHFERALAIDPEFAPALAGLASLEAQAYRNVDSDPGRLLRAGELAARALAIDPGLVRGRIAAGELRAAAFDYQGAAELFADVLSDEPWNDRAWDYLSWVLPLCVPPRLDEAEHAARRAIALNPGFAEAHYHLARVLAAQGRVADAEQAIAAVEEHAPEAGLARMGRFWIQLAAGRAREAAEALASSADLRGSSLRPAWLAAAFAQAGDLPRALALLEWALEMGYRDGPGLRASPWYEPLRRDPAFHALLARHGLGGRGGTSPRSPG